MDMKQIITKENGDEIVTTYNKWLPCGETCVFFANGVSEVINVGIKPHPTTDELAQLHLASIEIYRNNY